MGGQGKTQIALEYGRRAMITSRFEAIYWVDASSSQAASRGFESITANIAGPSHMLRDVEAKIAFVRKTLSSWPRSWLLVFDNYDNPANFKDVADLFPNAGKGTILLTSPHTDSERLGNSIRVNGMTEDEGLELLLHRSRHEGNEENIRLGKEILLTLGGLALAIDQAGTYIGSRQLPLSLFTKHFNERRKDVLQHTPSSLWEYRRHPGQADEEALSVFTTWELSFNSIDQKRKRKIMSQLLTLSAFFNPLQVSEHFFQNYLESCSGTPQWMKWFKVDGRWNSHKYQDAVAELFALSIVQTFDVRSTQTCFSLHPLVRDWLELRETPARRQQFTIIAMRILAHYIDSQDIDALSLQTKQELLSHVDALQENEERYIYNVGHSCEKTLMDCISTFAMFYFRRDIISRQKYRTVQ